MNDDLLDRASDIAFSRLRAADDDPLRLPEPLRVVATIYSAQGVIDNGGLRYFFENDWPGQPPYSTFVEVYEALGAESEAASLAAAAALFSFEHPERDRDRRCEMLAGDAGLQVDELNRRMTSDVWDLLARYVRSNEAAIFAHGG